MRANGIAETFCTGEAPPYDKFLAWASTVPHCLRNPLYHWTHLELQRYFDVDELLDEESAPEIWQHANKLLETPELTAQGILAKFVCAPSVPPTTPPTICNPTPKSPRPTAHARLPDLSPDRALDVHLPPSSISGSSVSLPPPTSISVPSRLPGRLAQTPRFLPSSWLPSFRPRPGPLLRKFLQRIARARHFREGALRASPQRMKSTPNLPLT